METRKRHIPNDEDVPSIFSNNYLIIGILFVIIIVASLYYIYRDLTQLKNVIKQNTILYDQLNDTKNTMIMLEDKLNSIMKTKVSEDLLKDDDDDDNVEPSNDEVIIA